MGIIGAFHTIVDVDRVEPTCTERGIVSGIKCSGCNEIFRMVYINALGHAYDTVTFAPTCTNLGYKELTCTRCNDVIYIDTVAATGHSYITGITAPTCTEVGYTTHTCSVCEYSYNSDTVSANGHTPDSIVFENIIAATCTAAGSYDSVVYCSVCQAEQFREGKAVASNGHNYSSTVAAPTCTEVGYTTHVCSVCNHTYNSDTVAANGHTEVVDAAVAATCTTAGKTEGKHCSVCNEVIVTQTEVSALGHNYGDYVYNNDATTDADGTKTATMSTLDSLRYITRFMHCGFVAMEPHTGYVKAWVGDIDFDTWNYDKVTAQRQPGSTFKLFVYTEAMNAGLTPCKPYVDANYRIGGTWTPHNAGGEASGATMTLRTAFARSVNTIAARLGEEVGISNVARTAHRMGIKSHLEELPSLALGASDVNLLELVDAYCTVVNDGRVHEPVFITRILDRDGNEIYRVRDEQHEAIPYRSAFFMQQMLMGGLSGTSWSLRQYVGEFRDTDFGGKTGTSNNHSDAWFIGVTPQLVCGAWVGGEYRAIHFRTGQLGQGSRTALPICGRFLQAVLSDEHFSHYHAKFEPCKDPAILRSQYECGLIVNPLDSLLRFPVSSYDDTFDDIPEEITLPSSTSEQPEVLAEPVVE